VSSIPEVMRVPHFIGEGKITTVEKPVPQPGDGQLLIEVKANALCIGIKLRNFQGQNHSIMLFAVEFWSALSALVRLVA